MTLCVFVKSVIFILGNIFMKKKEIKKEIEKVILNFFRHEKEVMFEIGLFGRNRDLLLSQTEDGFEGNDVFLIDGHVNIEELIQRLARIYK